MYTIHVAVVVEKTIHIFFDKKFTMDENKDVLQTIPDEDLPKLREKYKNFYPRTAYVYNFLNCVVNWKTKRPDKEYVHLMAPHGNWEDGTFIALQKWSCYDLFVFTLNKNYEILYEALVQTRKVDWRRLIVLYAVQKDHHPIVLRALNEVEFPIHHSNVYDVWLLPKEKARNLEIDKCPSEVYVKKLEKSHTAVINSYWESRFPDSEEYLATFIELNGGYGAFLKSSNKLVAWILKNQIGMGALETLEGYKRKGYANIITKHLAKEIADSGEDPLGTVLQNNKQSQALFNKLGFVIVESVVFTEADITR